MTSFISLISSVCSYILIYASLKAQCALSYLIDETVFQMNSLNSVIIASGVKGNVQNLLFTCSSSLMIYCRWGLSISVHLSTMLQRKAIISRNICTPFDGNIYAFYSFFSSWKKLYADRSEEMLLLLLFLSQSSSENSSKLSSSCSCSYSQ